MGVLAAAGLVGLDSVESRMALDHERAKALSSAVRGEYISAKEAETNIVVLKTKCVSAEKLCSRLARARMKKSFISCKQNF